METRMGVCHGTMSRVPPPHVAWILPPDHSGIAQGEKRAEVTVVAACLQGDSAPISPSADEIVEDGGS
jgi:hypothetical protein